MQSVCNILWRVTIHAGNIDLNPVRSMIGGRRTYDGFIYVHSRARISTREYVLSVLNIDFLRVVSVK